MQLSETRKYPAPKDCGQGKLSQSPTMIGISNLLKCPFGGRSSEVRGWVGLPRPLMPVCDATDVVPRYFLGSLTELDQPASQWESQPDSIELTNHSFTLDRHEDYIPTTCHVWVSLFVKRSFLETENISVARGKPIIASVAISANFHEIISLSSLVPYLRPTRHILISSRGFLLMLFQVCTL